MKNFLIYLVLGLCSAQLFGAESVRLRSDIDLVVYGVTTSTIPIYSEKTADPTTEANKSSMYLPMHRTNGLDTNEYFVSSRAGSLVQVFDTASTTNTVHLPLRVTTVSQNVYLYAAVKDASSAFKVVKLYSASAFTQNTVNDVDFTFVPKDICTAYGGTICDNLATTSTNPTEQGFIVYFFLSDSSVYTIGNTVTITSPPFNSGIYFQVNMSNKVLTDAQLRITISDSRSGDKRVYLTYSASASIGNLGRAVKVYNHEGTPSAGPNLPIGSYTNTSGLFLNQDFPYAQSSVIEVTGLTNQVPYNFSLVFLDKYNFVTTLSDDIISEPKTIEELLKKQACFLLTAGFGEEHFVITYFRHFRDTVLAKSFLGRAFISVYYEYAPKYALVIYQHEGIRAVIRGAAYTMYFLFNYILWILGAGALCLAYFYLYKNKEKIKI